MHLMSLTSRILLIVGLLAILAACSSIGIKPQTDPDALRAQKLYAQKNYAGAAVLYQNLALRNKAQAAQYLLLGAEASLKAGNMANTQNLLNQLGKQTLDANQQLQYQLLSAELALKQKNSQQALAILSVVTTNEQHDQALRERYRRTLAQAYREREQLKKQQRIARIAVLLPQSGPYASAAQAVRDGLLISLYQMPAKQRPGLRFYDSSDTHAVWPVYNQAVDDGADLVIGPLQKAGVTQLARAGQLPTPVLALNRVSLNSMPSDNFYMFGLAPEDEARQVAERMWLDGLRRPVALAPEDDWGDRLINVFRERWLSLAGKSLDVRRYDPKGNDHSAAIVDLFHLDHSKARHAQLQRWLGMNLEFEPRRRTDIDGIFLIARNRQARNFAPQLKFHMAGNLPLYATSHAWTGQLSQQQLVDMRNIILPDIPLLAASGTSSKLAREIPEITSPLGRLYALGIDALALVPQLKRLQSDPSESMDGETGNLYMDKQNRIRRQLVWLKLDQPAKILGYAKRLDLPSALAKPGSNR